MTARVDAEVLVLGAGPAGIGVGLALGERSLVVDAAPHVGGLARTVDIDGALCDLGGHSFHTPHPDVRALVYDALPMEETRRDAWCYVAGAWVPYPFQRHFDRHPDPTVVAACRDGLASSGRTTDARDFDTWLDARFGPGIAEAFLRPYNRKLWGDDLGRMASTWTAERVAAPAGVAERFDEHKGRRRPLYDGTVVAYPSRGGYGEIFAALARRLPRLALGCEIVAVDARERTAHARDGRRFSFGELVSTLPLPRLLDVVGAPAPLRAMAARLEALPVTLAMLAVDGSPVTTRQRVYVADDTLPGHKIVLNGNSSHWLRSRPRHGIVVEVSRPSLERTGADRLLDRVVSGLVACGLVDDERRIAGRRMITLPLGYPVPTHERTAIVARARSWLGAHGFHTLGRFGEWDYINADEALHRGLRWPGATAAATGD